MNVSTNPSYVDVYNEIEETALAIASGGQPAYDNAHRIMHNAMHEITRIVNSDNCEKLTIKELTMLADVAAYSIRYTNPDGLSGLQVIKRITDATEQATTASTG